MQTSNFTNFLIKNHPTYHGGAVLHTIWDDVFLYIEALRGIDSCVEPSSPEKQTSLQAGLGSTGWQRGKPRGLVGRKEVVKQDWIPTPPLTDFSLENVFLSITREKVRELQRQWEEMMKSDCWQNSSFSCHCTWWGRSCAAARQIC